MDNSQTNPALVFEVRNLLELGSPILEFAGTRVVGP